MKPASNASEMAVKSQQTASVAAETAYRFERYELDCLQWQLRWGDEVLPINRKSFDLLLFLIQAAPRVVTKDEIMSVVWRGQIVRGVSLSGQQHAAGHAA